MLSPRTFTNKGMAESVEFKVNLKDILHFHKHKLHTILFDGKLHPAVRRQQSNEFDDEKVAPTDKEARMKDFLEACNEDALGILIFKIADPTLKNRLRRKYNNNDAHGA
eukprot:6178961-Pleurochrysis_carterae.AAC.1